MALAPSLVSKIRQGDRWRRFYDVVWDSSYPGGADGGEPFTAAMLGVGSIYDVRCNPALSGDNLQGFEVAWDSGNAKLVALAARTGESIVTVNWNPASVSAGATATEAVTVTGAVLGQTVRAVKPTVDAGLVVVAAYVSAADTVTVTFENTSGGAINAAAENWLFYLSGGPLTQLPTGVDLSDFTARVEVLASE